MKRIEILVKQGIEELRRQLQEEIYSCYPDERKITQLRDQIELNIESLKEE